ncbi:MAG: ATPase, T2SS/T4P/T4SS family [Erysipelotrichaceae bacterium]|nr:ATPase, T2SS/T4P/T4SS family [Erysipelotrichaceae bacterium]
MKPDKQLVKILTIALKEQVTDIHFMIKNGLMTIQLRTIKGIRNLSEPSCSIELFHYLKYIANLDLADSLKPQTGTFQYNLDQRTLFLRFAVINSLNITSGVLRILYQKVLKKEISIFPIQNRLIGQNVRRSSGLIILSGPTGSGKTSTAYTMLSQIKEKKIFTIEDPIEMLFENFVQVQVNSEKGITYESGIKQLLRHDPDVIFIGEIRDAYEAAMAVRCALTGHLVLTTIHARSCAGVIQRMNDLAVNMSDFYQTIILITNQRIYTRTYQKERICLYETMAESELAFYRDHQGHSEDHRLLSYYFSEAKRKRIIPQNCEF